MTINVLFFIKKNLPHLSRSRKSNFNIYRPLKQLDRKLRLTYFQDQV
jgi:hypothetical protein